MSDYQESTTFANGDYGTKPATVEAVMDAFHRLQSLHRPNVPDVYVITNSAWSRLVADRYVERVELGLFGRLVYKVPTHDLAIKLSTALRAAGMNVCLVYDATEEPDTPCDPEPK